jgi:hypothetical protein
MRIDIDAFSENHISICMTPTKKSPPLSKLGENTRESVLEVREDEINLETFREVVKGQEPDKKVIKLKEVTFPLNKDVKKSPRKLIKKKKLKEPQPSTDRSYGENQDETPMDLHVRTMKIYNDKMEKVTIPNIPIPKSILQATYYMVDLRNYYFSNKKSQEAMLYRIDEYKIPELADPEMDAD